MSHATAVDNLSISGKKHSQCSFTFHPYSGNYMYAKRIWDVWQFDKKDFQFWVIIQLFWACCCCDCNPAPPFCLSSLLRPLIFQHVQDMFAFICVVISPDKLGSFWDEGWRFFLQITRRYVFRCFKKIHRLKWFWERALPAGQQCLWACRESCRQWHVATAAAVSVAVANMHFNPSWKCIFWD